MTQLKKVFEVKWQGFSLHRGAVLAVVLGLLLIVGVLPHERRYFLSAIFGALFVAVSDPGGKYGPRVLAMAAMAGAGALLTALGFGIGGGPWGFVVLAAFVATLLAGMAVKYGLHRFVAAYLLNIWFIIALGLPTLLSFGLPNAFHSGLIHTEPWKQALAWLTGSALWVAYTFIMWLARGRVASPQPAAEIPGDISPRPLTRPLILFAVIRAVAVSSAVAIAFGLQLPNAYWMPFAVIIAIKPDLQQSTFIAVQRVAGTILGAVVAAVVLLAVDNRTALEVIIVAPVRGGGVDPLRQLRLVHRSHGRGAPDRDGRAPPVQLCQRGTQDPVHIRRRRDRRHRHVPGRPTAKARRHGDPQITTAHHHLTLAGRAGTWASEQAGRHSRRP